MSLANVVVHESQFPSRVRRQLLDCLRQREFRQKFHYDSLKQARKWLALHEALAPSVVDPLYANTYDQACEAALRTIEFPEVHLIGLGCGGGEKELRLLKLLCRGSKVHFTPIDVSVAMALTATEAALELLPEAQCSPVVCDLPEVAGWKEILPPANADLPRVLTFLGMLPTLTTAEVLPKLRDLVRAGDSVLLSANLAPGPDYAAGVLRVLPQYDNPLTRDWLMTLLLELGFESSDGRLVFAVEENPAGSGLLRIQATFYLESNRQIRVYGEPFDFRAGEKIRIFYSYRHTPALVCKLLAQHGLKVSGEWIAATGEEGVFLARGSD